MNGAGNVFEVMQKYFDHSIAIVLAILCIIWYWQKAKKEVRIFIVALGICLVLVFNDLSYFIINKIGETETYYRFIWMVPVLLLAAHLLIWVYEELETKGKKILFCAIVAIGIFSFGSEKLAHFTKLPENIYQIPQRIIDICNVIDTRRLPEESVIVLAEEETLYGVREYNAYIMEPYQGDYEYLLSMLEKNDCHINGVTGMAMLKSSQIEYMVLEKKDTCAYAGMLSMGCVPLGETGEYVILDACLKETEEHFALYDANQLQTEIPVFDCENVYVGLDEKIEFVYYPDKHLSYWEPKTEKNIHIFTEESEFQKVEFDGFTLCAINTDDNQIEDATVREMKKVLEADKKTIVFVTTPLYQEEILFEDAKNLFGYGLTETEENAAALFEMLTASESNIAAVFANSQTFSSKEMINETILQYVCETDGTVGTMIYIK